MERIKVFNIGSKDVGKVIPLSQSLEELLKVAGQKLNISARKLYTIDGCEIDDICLIRDNDSIFISEEEKYTYTQIRKRLNRFQIREEAKPLTCDQFGVRDKELKNLKIKLKKVQKELLRREAEAELAEAESILQEKKIKELRKCLLILFRKIAILKLGEIATIVKPLSNGKNRLAKTFFKKHQCDQDRLNALLDRVKSTRCKIAHPYGYKPKIIRIPDLESVEKIVAFGNFRGKKLSMYSDF